MRYCKAMQRTDGTWDFIGFGSCTDHLGTHQTAQEACDCCKAHLIKTQMHMSTDSNQQWKCKVCGEWTSTWVLVGGVWLFKLCSAHGNEEEISKLLEITETSEMWVS